MHLLRSLKALQGIVFTAIDTDRGSAGGRQVLIAPFRVAGIDGIHRRKSST